LDWFEGTGCLVDAMKVFLRRPSRDIPDRNRPSVVPAGLMISDSNTPLSPAAPAVRPHLLGLTREQLAAWAVERGFARLHALTLWHEIHQKGRTTFTPRDRMPPRFLQRVDEELAQDRPTVAKETHSSDGFTRKYLLALADGRLVETVLMRYHGRTTACVSSQVGCAMGCTFCATGQMGYVRHLTAAEIVAQALHVDAVLRETAPSTEGPPTPAPALAKPEHPSAYHRHERLRNIVFMGMGEPLHNYDAVMQAVDILREPSGLAMAGERLTVSTVGVVPGIRRLALEGRPVSLAVSLHGATQEERATLVPAARRWPLDELMDACREYTAITGRRIFFEWTLIDGRNDRVEDARAVAALLRGIPAQVNLIPLNPTGGYDGRPGGVEGARRFQDTLKAAGIPSTVRQRRGIDIAAGCGQLAVG
jgi:23S rRNA (adenine2503-C2)-methyltransferase